MSATVHPFPPSGRPIRRNEPRYLWGLYTPPPGSVVCARECGNVFDIEVIEPGGEIAILATCGDRYDAEYHARVVAEEYKLEVVA
jgi:hypothetical protein